MTQDIRHYMKLLEDVVPFRQRDTRTNDQKYADAIRTKIWI